MAVSFVAVKDAANVTRNLAARNLNSTDVFYQMEDPEVLAVRIVAAGAGDATLISAVACVVRAVRLFNGGGVACHAKLHNLATTPVVGTTPVVYSASAQAGVNNPDQRVGAGGLAFSTGLGVSLTTGIPYTDTTGVAAGSAVLIIEYHLA